MQDPDLATQELERCVKELGMVGVLVNGCSEVGREDNAVYYDLPQYRPFWAAVERLDVPFYLHPRNPIPSNAKIYDGHAWLLGPTWAFAQETAVHSLRLMGSGLFDEHPGLRIVIGHLGEGIPASLWRIDYRNDWMHRGHACPAKRTMGEYFRENFYVTTSGNFHTPTLKIAIEEIGLDRVMFSTDWPFESMEDACGWFDKAEIGEDVRAKVGRDNAKALFKL